MNLDEIDLLKISDAQAIKINSSLPKPNEEIVGHVSVGVAPCLKNEIPEI
jgi:hypothetical protein